ncbi:glycosyltransferase family 2 protein [Chamaesiphon minutus]|uniref:Putative glycosyltransferase n=1 Tax=Chamaesiphon minutus (strain ATCC 27169 / PCC 6605) TaxID=1173020 RepID=K9UE05_CHAP6|nr:glycosyltransferase family A protein [Chamaesiphon minutus]AFY92666.1 putative glycosyltransferase [Chamaesiphon minutus PCC 6605]
MPQVTVIVPAYNAMTYLPETVNSALAQSFTDFELLIINDGSTDRLSTWAATLSDPRVRLISQANQGLPGARNTGIREAQGQYIAFLDADDLWAPTKLERQVQCLQANSTIGVVYTWTLLVDEVGQPTGRIFASQAEGNVWQQLLETDVISNGSSAMVRRECFEKVGNFDRTLTSAEDLDMWLRLAAHYPFAVVKEPLTLYRQYASSMSKNRQRMFQNLRMAIEKAFQTAPMENLHLRSRAYASITLNQAWWSVGEGDCQTAKVWQQQARLHYPKIQYSQKYLRLQIAVLLTQLFGLHGYDGLRHWTRSVYRMVLDRRRSSC